MWHKMKFRNVWTIKTESIKLRYILSLLNFAVIEYLILRLTCYEHQLEIFSWSFFMLVIIEFMIVRVIEMFLLSELVHSSIILHVKCNFIPVGVPYGAWLPAWIKCAPTTSPPNTSMPENHSTAFQWEMNKRQQWNVSTPQLNNKSTMFAMLSVDL